MSLICLQIDLGRQKETLEFIESYVDFAKENGYNSMLVYLENAVRTADTPFFNKEETYSVEEIKRMVAYAEGKGIELIPAFENLGHLEKFMAYPQFADIAECEDAQKEGRGFYTGHGTCGCIQKPRLYEVMDKYITDVAALFNSEYIHVGLDEPFDFAVCERCRAELDKGTTKAELFYRHIMHTYELVRSLGKTMMMWDDFFEYADIAEKLPRDIIFCNWNYYFIGDEPGGHWSNRVKRDWFAYYDKLGFRYMFCTYASSASSTYNVDTFTEYAEKYHPIGAMMTVWERSELFHQGLYPLIAYAGQRWSGKLGGTEEEKLAVYEKLLGSRGAAEEVLALQIPSFYWGGEDVGVKCENDNLVKMAHRDGLKRAVKALDQYLPTAEGLQKDCLLCIRDFVFERYLGLVTERLGTDIFNAYEAKNKPLSYFVEKLDEIAQGYAQTEEHGKYLWEKYRKGILSCNGAFAKKYEGKRAQLEKIKEDIVKNADCGVLYVDLMMHDGFGTPRAGIYVTYEGEQETLLYRGGMKSTYVGFEAGGCYTLRFAIENKPLQSVRFSVFGEDAIYPTHFRYTRGGEKFVAGGVEVLSGKVERSELLLENNSRFAMLGNDDGAAHFNDVELCKKESAVKITFKKLV